MKSSAPIVKHEEAAAKAAVLVESLSWLKAFHGTTMVIKFGGNAMTDPALFDAFADDVVFLRLAGITPIVVHGGGPQINTALAAAGIESSFAGGYRVTDAASMSIIRDVLADDISADIARAINSHGAFAERANLAEAPLLFGRRMPAVSVDGQEVDLGLVGDVTEVRADALQPIIDRGVIPVISTVARSTEADEWLNVNADAAAAAIAVALKAEKLLMLTDVAGLFSDWPNQDTLISAITADELRALLPELESGMIPKMQACLEAVEHGVAKAAIIDGRIPHSMLLEVFTQRGIGTEVTL